MNTSQKIEIIDRLESLKRGNEAIKALPCKCSGFVIQYEGGCQCSRGSALKENEQATNDLLSLL